MSSAAVERIELWKDHWQDEGDAAFLYKVLAEQEPDDHRAVIYRRLADVEDRHVKLWGEVLKEHGTEVGPFRPSLRARFLAWSGRRVGPKFLLPLLLAEEGREMKGYLGEYRAAPEGRAGETALVLARESAHHAETLGALLGREGEPWHRTESGGFLRNVVYGFNDGLTANFGLVMGVIGASVAPQRGRPELFHRAGCHPQRLRYVRGRARGRRRRLRGGGRHHAIPLA